MSSSNVSVPSVLMAGYSQKIANHGTLLTHLVFLWRTTEQVTLAHRISTTDFKQWKPVGGLALQQL